MRSKVSRDRAESGRGIPQRTIGRHDVSKTLSLDEELLESLRVLLDDSSLETGNTLVATFRQLGSRRKDKDTGGDSP